MIYKNNRQPLLYDYIKQHKNVKNTELQAEFHVADMTIRRDLTYLEECGLIIRTHGGAMLPEAAEISSETAPEQECIQRYEALALQASALVQEAQSIYADSSREVLDFIRILPKFPSLTVFTNSLAVIKELQNQSDRISVISFGGVLSSDGNRFGGYLTAEAASAVHVDLCFLSCGGFDAYGVYAEDDFDIQTVKLMLKQAKCVILMADAKKAGVEGMFRLCGWNQIQYLLLQNRMTGEIRESILETLQKETVQLMELS